MAALTDAEVRDLMDQAVALLTGLGDTPQSVQDSLAAAGPLTYRADTPDFAGCRCPVACFLAMRTGVVFVVGRSEFYVPVRSLTSALPIPVPVRKFIGGYDSDRDRTSSYAALIPTEAPESTMDGA